jgi:hypothetical protein
MISWSVVELNLSFTTLVESRSPQDVPGLMRALGPWPSKQAWAMARLVDGPASTNYMPRFQAIQTKIRQLLAVLSATFFVVGLAPKWALRNLQKV